MLVYTPDKLFLSMDAAETAECVSACSVQNTSRILHSTERSVFIDSGPDCIHVMRSSCSGRVIVHWDRGGIGFVARGVSGGLYVADLHTQGRLYSMTDSSISRLVSRMFRQHRIQSFSCIQAAVRRALLSVSRRLALAMAFHGRLGLGCLIAAVPEEVVVGLVVEW